MDFRPMDPASLSATGDAGAAAMTTDMSHAGVSASAEFSGSDLSRAAQQFFQPGAGDGGALASKALSSLDISGISAASSPMVGTEAAAMLPAAPGTEAGVLAGLAGANEPISPVIQLIMKLPGAMGIVNSFFEFLANFLFSPANLIDLFNPMTLAQHAAAVFSGAHMPMISLSMLPSNAPILSSLSNLGQPMMASDLMSAKLNLSLGNSSAYSSLAKGGIDTTLNSNSLNVGGELSPQSAVYETGGANSFGGVPQGHLSGPSLTDVGQANHVAGNTRLFSDRIGGSSFNSNSMNLAAKTPSPYGTTPTGINNGVVPQGLTAQAPAQPGSFLSNARFEGAPNVGAIKQNFVPHAGQEVGYSSMPNAGQDYSAVGGQDVGYNAGVPTNMDASGVSYGPSGSVPSEVGTAGGGNNNMLAMDQPVQSFKPTLGSDNQLRSAYPSANQANTASSGQPATGLKAKQLSLDSVANDAPVKSTASTAHSAASAPAPHKAAETAVAKAAKPADAPAPAHKVAEAPAHKAAEAPAHKVAEAPHKAAPQHHEAPKHVAHKPAHVSKPEVSKPEVAQQQPAEAVDQQTGNALEGQAADSMVADGTQVATNDAAATTQQYTIQKGDNLWNIAKQHLGEGAKWQDIYKLNESTLGQNPDLIYPGTTIELPGAEIANSGTTTMTNYVVKPGDNLWDISHDLLGKGSRWGELYQANQDIIGANPRLIHPGQELSIPSSDPSGTVANSSVDPNAAAAGGNVDPNSMGAQQPAAGDPSISENVDSVKSMQGTGTEYGAMPEQQYSVPQTQMAPQAQVAPAVQQVSSYPQAAGDYVSMNAPAAATPNAFQPTVAQASRGLPVIPANSTPIDAGPGAAMAATPHEAAAANNMIASNASNAAASASAAGKGAVVSSSGYLANLKNLFNKTK